MGFERRYCSGPVKYEPFTLSLSKGFDKLSPNGNLIFISRINQVSIGLDACTVNDIAPDLLLAPDKGHKVG